MLAMLFSLTFPAAAFFLVYVQLLFGGVEGDRLPAEGAWRALRGGIRCCYLAAALLPLLGFGLLAAHLDGGGSIRMVPDRRLLLPALSFLLGIVNLGLAFAGRLPRKHSRLWHILLTASLLPSLALATEAWVLWMLDLADSRW